MLTNLCVRTICERGAAAAVRAGTHVDQLLADRVLRGRIHPHQCVQAAVPRKCKRCNPDFLFRVRIEFHAICYESKRNDQEVRQEVDSENGTHHTTRARAHSHTHTKKKNIDLLTTK